MANTSVIESVQNKYATLTFSNKPPILWFVGRGGTVPLNNPDGTPVTFPFVCFSHVVAPYGITLEYTAMRDWIFEFNIFSLSLAELEGIADGILYNANPPESALGFAYGTLTLPTGDTFLSFEMMGEGPIFAPSATYRSSDSVPVFQASWNMLVKSGPASA